MSRGRGLAVGTGRGQSSLSFIMHIDDALIVSIRLIWYQILIDNVGGAGNMSHSQVRGGEESAAAIEAARSRSRSRARAAHHGHDAPQASGRGGAGNVHRSPSGSRDPTRAAQSRERAQKMAIEDEVTRRKYEELHQGDERTAGRGGFGNLAHHHAQPGQT